MSSAKLEHKGYNRGLILGLTMAESMILLVFCLLLVAAAIILAEREKRQAAEVQVAELREQLADIRRDRDDLGRRLALVANPSDRAAVEEEWRELVSAREARLQMDKQGIAVEELADLANARELLRAGGYDLESVDKLMERLAELQQQLQARAESGEQPHQWPPIISLSDADDYSFEIGSAELTPSFEQSLRGDITRTIAESLDEYNVDIVEVIGHTDEQRIARKESNFDQTVLDVLARRTAVDTIVPGDNAGLGLARAIAVANVLRSEPALSGMTVLPLSAGQLIMPGDRLTTGKAGDMRERRRIEIRIRRRDTPDTP